MSRPCAGCRCHRHAHLERLDRGASRPVELQQWGGTLLEDGELGADRFQIVVDTLGAIAAHVGLDSPLDGLAGAGQVDHRADIEQRIEGRRLAHVAGQPV